MPAIAIIGASNNRNKFSNKCVRLYKRLGWNVFPVNPNEKEIEGLKCYCSITEVSTALDRVSVYLPAQVTLSLIQELLKAGVKSVILNPGAESAELLRALRDNGITPKLACSIRMEGYAPEAID